MPIVRKGGAGCRLSGVVKGPAGQVELKPTQGGVYEGVVYGRDPIALTIDADGRFEVVVPPSAAVGPYRLRVGKATFLFTVPDEPAVQLSDLLALKEPS